MAVDLSVRIGSLVLKNPVLTASGTFGYGTEYSEYFDPSLLGGIVTKTITLEPRAGNPMPRIAETPAGMLNSIGLANVGVEKYITEKLPLLEGLDTAVIANVAGNTAEEYGVLVRRLSGLRRVDAFEINISCPNVRKDGLAFGMDAEATRDVVRCVRSETDKTVIVKLTPNVTDIVAIARAAVEAGADALSLINTVLGMAVDIETRRPLLARVTGGLSGPAIKPIALARLYQVRQSLDVPLIGIGGIMTAGDALEFFFTGATAVEVGTLNFIDPLGSVSILSGLVRYCEGRGISSFSSIIGTLVLES
ncbi:dihydroorotate dehydrogenase [bacterium]|nr:dihydroorotate dehydrogenase [bacterium]